MRLINASTLQLEEFFNSNTPKYAILSHTWGNEEISLADARGILPQMSTPLALRNAGLEKIIKACAQALKDGLRYVWVDTCCIDKTSSAELSEAINSMFRWYEKSEVCYAYLADVPPQDNWDSKNPGHVFSSSRWFTRGWTLQELLAPSKVIFFASDWSSIATRGELSSSISSITGIDASFLLDSSQSGNGQAGGILPRVSPFDDDSLRRRNYQLGQGQSRKLPSASMAERMSWAAKRETTRVEDVAYSLLGILGVNMPLIYGEGERAFIRLQEEVLRVSDDLTILAWGFGLKERPRRPPKLHHPWRVRAAAGFIEFADFEQLFRFEQFFPSSGLLAARPAEFEDCGDIIQMDLGAIHVPITLSGRQLSARLPLSEEKLEPYLVLPCRFKSDPFHMLAIPLARRDRDTFARASSRHRQGILVDHATWERWQTTSVKLMTYIRDDDRKKRIPDYSLCIRGLPDGFGITAVNPSATYIHSEQIIIPNPLFNDLFHDQTMKVELLLQHSDTKAEFLVRIKATQLGKRSVMDKSRLHVFYDGIWNTANRMHEVKTQPYIDFEQGMLYVTLSERSFQGVTLLLVDFNHTKNHFQLVCTLLKLRLAVTRYLAISGLNQEPFFLINLGILFGLVALIHVLESRPITRWYPSYAHLPAHGSRETFQSAGHFFPLGTRENIFRFSCLALTGFMAQIYLPWLSMPLPRAAPIIRKFRSFFALKFVFLIVLLDHFCAFLTATSFMTMRDIILITYGFSFLIFP